MAAKLLHLGMAESAIVASLSPSRKVVLSGAPAAALATWVTARFACERKTVRIICADNRFDAYAVARMARFKGITARDALNSIKVARAFTAYQLVELVRDLNPHLPDSVILISGVCSPFFDEDLSLVDAARIFYKTLWRLVELGRGGMTLLLTQPAPPANMRRAYFLKDLCRACDITMSFDGKHSFTLEHRRRISLPRFAALDPDMGT